jgi:hypothetical protein
MSQRSLSVALAASLAVAACGGGASQQQSAPQAPPATQAPATTAAAAPAATGAAEFGVPECDDYINKYVACIDSKVPEAGRAMIRQQLDQTKAQWQQAASTPEGKAGLAGACKTMTETAKTAMAAYGCTF